MRKPKKIGIVGGSYNPIHNAHLIIAEHFREQMDLDLVLLIPSNISPNKVAQINKYIDSTHRLNMVVLACRNNKYFRVDDVEIQRNGISYTIDTLKYLKSKYLNAELFLLIGEDQAINFNKWNRWQEILKYSQLCIAGRNQNLELSETTQETINNIFDEINYKPIWITSPLMDISSSNIRNRISKGQSIKYQVPNSVLSYIEKNNLYK